MTISYNWLKDYIEIPESPEELAGILTSTGLEVESVEEHETVRGGLKGLVIGEVLTCSKHPNADKLSLTTVDVGGERPLHIVCGAPNVAAGQKVIVAIPGTTLYPAGGEPFTIKASKIRGEQSEGMICAEDEIGIGHSHAGIIVLPSDTKVGTQAAHYYKVQSDYVLEIGLTPNRADAASHIGVARDIKAAKKRDLHLPSVESFKKSGSDFVIEVVVENAEACPRYSGVSITGVKVAESPDWLKDRLTTIGLTPINNIVDITNYVLHETGQPLHAFDADKIKGRKVVVKTLPEGSRFVTLDQKERKLLSGDLMICDAEEGMCIAGVFGGVHSGITDQSVNVFLESACFSPDYIRKTSMHHQLKTDASFRFERGTDPSNTVYALKRAAMLMCEIAGGKIASNIVDVYTNPAPARKITVKHKNVTRLIGRTISSEEIYNILELLDFVIEEKSTEQFVVAVPTYRVEIFQEADVVEEILRIYGFNNIELSETASTDFLAAFPAKDPDNFKRTVGEMLAGNGFFEIWTNSLTNAGYQQKHNLKFDGDPVEVLNKLSEEQGILRQTLLFTGLEVCSYNINRKQKDLKLFEFGKIYYKRDGAYGEEERLALFISGARENENWQRKVENVTYYDIAHHVSQILAKCGVANTKQQVIKDQLFEYGLQLTRGKDEIGRIGKVKTAFLKDLSIKQEIFYAELNTALLFQAANPKLVIQEIPKFPEVRRDLSLVLDKQISFDEIRSLVMSTERKLIRNVIAFDVYEGEKIAQGKKAYALGFTLQDESKTLTDEEIDKTMQKLMSAFEQKLGAVIRK